LYGEFFAGPAGAPSRKLRTCGVTPTATPTRMKRMTGR
jgi:hypothetical protein